METFFSSLCDYADHAHLIFFALLMLAGLNFPFSEDIILLTGGAIASTCIPEHTMRMYLWIYFGCWISAWEAYSLGRFVGPKLYHIAWFRNIVSEARVATVSGYLERFGIFAFIVGRFIPGGMRNILFISCGLCKMVFLKFILRDGCACLISSSILFTLGYQFGKNYDTLVKFFAVYRTGVLILVVTGLVLGLTFYLYKRAERKKSDPSQ